MRRLILISLALGAASATLVITGSSSQAESNRWQSPIPGSSIVRVFDMTSNYGPGHRGVDLAAKENSSVYAVAAGTVTWSGKVAGRTTITIDHGEERSTYEPVTASVSNGDRVSRGDHLGTLAAGHGECLPACLHLGRIRDGTYLDPAERFEASEGYRLISPIGPPPKPPALLNSSGSLPTNGLITSPFGMRSDPFTKVQRFHDGTDIGAPCGQPVFSVASGVVTHAHARGGYGLLVEVKHAGHTTTGYAHLSAVNVTVGERVERGTLLGKVGTTGRSTGCHLHFMKRDRGRAVDPQVG